MVCGSPFVYEFRRPDLNLPDGDVPIIHEVHIITTHCSQPSTGNLPVVTAQVSGTYVPHKPLFSNDLNMLMFLVSSRRIMVQSRRPAQCSAHQAGVQL